LSGSVDGALIIDGNRSDKNYTLSLIGRDIPDDEDLAIQRACNGERRLLGQAKHVFVSAERQAIRDLLSLHPAGLAPKDMADLLAKKQAAVRKLLSSMVADGQVIVDKSSYTLPSTPTLHPARPTTLSLSSSSGADGGCRIGGIGGKGNHSGNADHSGNGDHSGSADHKDDVGEPHALPV
jgi:hypothetical protein